MNINKYLKIIGILALFMIFAGQAHAQAIPSDDVLKACEQTADLAKRVQIENTSLKAQLDIANQRVMLRDEQLANKEEQVQFYKKASEKGDQIDTTSNLIIYNLRQQVADDQIRIKDLEYETRDLRKSRNFRTVVGFGAGLATGYLIHK